VGKRKTPCAKITGAIPKEGKLFQEFPRVCGEGEEKSVRNIPKGQKTETRQEGRKSLLKDSKITHQRNPKEEKTVPEPSR